MSESPCPVCGHLLDEPSRSLVTGGGSYEICASCGIQFGYSDEAGGDLASRERIYAIWRREWEAAGSPPDWAPGKTLIRQMVSEAMNAG